MPIPSVSKILSGLLDPNPFLANVPILYSMKTQENHRFPGVFGRYKWGNTEIGHTIMNIPKMSQQKILTLGNATGDFQYIMFFYREK